MTATVTVVVLFGDIDRYESPTLPILVITTLNIVKCVFWQIEDSACIHYIRVY